MREGKSLHNLSFQLKQKDCFDTVHSLLIILVFFFLMESRTCHMRIVLNFFLGPYYSMLLDSINMTFIWLDDISSSELGYSKCLM